MIYKVLVNHAMVYTTEREINDETVDIKTTSCGTVEQRHEDRVFSCHARCEEIEGRDEESAPMH